MSLDRYYIGSSENVENRLKKHLANQAGFTAKAKDWQIKYTEVFPDKLQALKREKQLKGWENRERLKQLINGNPLG